MGWLISLIVLAVIACIPLGISGHYDSNGVFVCLIIGPARLPVFPQKSRKGNKEKRHASPKKGKPSTKVYAREKGGLLSEFKPFVKLFLDLVIDLRRKIRVNYLQVRLVLAGGDPCDLAINYGRAWSTVGAILPRLEDCFAVQKKDIEIECDFTSEQTLVLAHMDITITVARLFSIGLLHGVRILRAYLKIINQRKGGAEV